MRRFSKYTFKSRGELMAVYIGTGISMIRFNKMAKDIAERGCFVIKNYPSIFVWDSHKSRERWRKFVPIQVRALREYQAQLKG